MKHIILLVTFLCVTMGLNAKSKNDTNELWQKTIIAAIDSFPENGGYYTGRKTNADFPRSAWRAFSEAFQFRLVDRQPSFNPQKAKPSFCSLASYALLIKALTMYDKDYKISREAWLALKPYCGVVDALNPQGYNQDDGEGCWGRANANGPGIAVLVNEVKAGYSFTAFRGAKSDKNKENPKEQYMTDEQWSNQPIWTEAQPGDFMKIFWDRNETKGSDCGAIIGCNDIKEDDQEQGHAVIFLGITPEGNVKYWSSNGPGSNPKEKGYGVAECSKNKIQRVVFTRITNPENFNNAKNIRFNNTNKWLSDLNGKKHGTTAELKKNCGIKPKTFIRP